MEIFTPNLALIKYVGEIPRKLWEARARKVPVLNKGDMVLLPEVTAVLMCKKNGFILVDSKELSFASENKEQKNIEEYLAAIGMSETDIEKFILKNDIGSDDEEAEKFWKEEIPELPEVDEFVKMEEKMLKEKQDESEEKDEEEIVLPKKDELKDLDEETVKELCNHLSIKIGNKKLDTLKSILLPYLPE